MSVCEHVCVRIGSHTWRTLRVPGATNSCEPPNMGTRRRKGDKKKKIRNHFSREKRNEKVASGQMCWLASLKTCVPSLGPIRQRRESIGTGCPMTSIREPRHTPTSTQNNTKKLQICSAHLPSGSLIKLHSDLRKSRDRSLGTGRVGTQPCPVNTNSPSPSRQLSSPPQPQLSRGLNFLGTVPFMWSLLASLVFL